MNNKDYDDRMMWAEARRRAFVPSLITKIIWFALLCSLLLAFGCSPTRKAQRLARQALSKIEEAKRLDPGVIDSIFGTQKVAIDLPAVAASHDPEPEIDTTEFFRQMKQNDSLVAIADTLSQRLASEKLTSLEREKVMDAMAHNNKALQANQNRLMRGFSKDSTYHYEDSLLVVDVELKGGVIHKVFHKVKERHIEKEVPKTDILLDTHKDPPYREPWFWALGGLSALLIMALILVILVTRKR